MDVVDADLDIDYVLGDETGDGRRPHMVDALRARRQSLDELLFPVEKTLRPRRVVRHERNRLWSPLRVGHELEAGPHLWQGSRRELEAFRDREPPRLKTPRSSDEGVQIDQRRGRISLAPPCAPFLERTNRGQPPSLLRSGPGAARRWEFPRAPSRARRACPRPARRPPTRGLPASHRR